MVASSEMEAIDTRLCLFLGIDRGPEGYEVDYQLRAGRRGATQFQRLDPISPGMTALPDFDVCDTNAFKAAFGERAYQIPITSIKSMIGQAISVSGLCQVIAACLSLRHHVLPPTINQEAPDASGDLDYARTARDSIANNVLIKPTAMAAACLPSC